MTMSGFGDVFGEGSSKKQAEQNAAQNFLKKFGSDKNDGAKN